mmetsp:Transcript_16179/g.50888  ORF Transcript_16179/g.50888 Transcript_16179/m.50888 type:complete len:265 (+) Transcript_16179:48-842(+)
MVSPTERLQAFMAASWGSVRQHLGLEMEHDAHYQSVLLTLFAPFALLLLVLLVASLEALPKPLVHGQHMDVGSLAKVNDVCVRGFGEYLPLLLFAVQCWLLPYPDLAEHGVIRKDHGIVWLPKRFWMASLLIWLAIILFRLLFYLCMKNWHYFFSDHIFLITSIVGMVQMKLYPAHHDLLKHGARKGCVATLVVGWLLVLMVLFESYVTVKYYHTLQASWTAFFTGGLMFGGVAFWWIRTVRPEGEARCQGYARAPEEPEPERP